MYSYRWDTTLATTGCGHPHSFRKDRYLVRDLAIFGSYARGDQRPDSDLDILVDVDSSIGLGFVELADHLEKTLGLRVDLVSSRALKPRMREAIQRDLIHV